METGRYLNIYIYGERQKLPELMNELNDTIDGDWSVIDTSSRRKEAGESCYEYQLTVNNTTGFLRFYATPGMPYLLFLRDSGIVGAKQPISVQDNDYLVSTFSRTYLKDLCKKMDLKMQVTRKHQH